ncbi:hypothetical protein [Streptomyces sp. NPDC001970]
MNHSENVDQDTVLRARTMLLGSGRLGLHQEVGAYRVLAEVSPLAYLPRLTRALLTLSHREFRDRPEIRLSVIEEAVAAARRFDEREPKRAELLIDALDAYQHRLYALGRRAEGFSVREEIAEIGRQAFEAGQVSSPVYGLGPLATALAEEGRHREAAQAYGKIVEAGRSQGRTARTPDWSMLEWSAELDAAGEHAAALDAFAELVGNTRAELDEGDTSLAILVWDLVRFSQMLDAHGRCGEAHEARGEALGLLTELAETGERKGWSSILAWWAVLLGLSGRADEQPASPGEPAPPFGSDLGWSPDVRQAYFDGRTALEHDAAALASLARTDPRGHLAELVAVHRRLTIRSAIHWQARTYLIMEPLRPLFDQGVTLARRLAELDKGHGSAMLARALTDRSTLLIAVRCYAEALADFQEAAGLLR